MDTQINRGRLALTVLGVAAAALAVAFVSSRAVARAGAKLAPVGIIDAFSVEQAPILAQMKVTGRRVIDGLTFYEGTIKGFPVVNVQSGEMNEQAQLATYILDTTFHPRAVLYSGTAGAQNAGVHVGDVVLSGFVTDKSAIHYYLGGYQGPYGAVEVQTTKHSDLKGAIYRYAESTPATPSDAKTYGSGPTTVDKTLKMVSAFAAPEQLVTTGLRAASLLATTQRSDATGISSKSGTITNRVIAGVIGTAEVWTEPLPWIAAQNALYPTDAEENEGPGFAFANAQLGVPWLLVRGISDSVWYPNAYDGVLAAQQAAIVDSYLVEHLPAKISTKPETLASLSPISNARRYGYLVADKAYFKVGPVRKILSGRKTITGAALHKLAGEYTYAAGRL
jgi:adenosylhomocysteine nucleosidase